MKTKFPERTAAIATKELTNADFFGKSQGKESMGFYITFQPVRSHIVPSSQLREIPVERFALAPQRFIMGTDSVGNRGYESEWMRHCDRANVKAAHLAHMLGLPLRERAEVFEGLDGDGIFRVQEISLKELQQGYTLRDSIFLDNRPLVDR